MIANPVHRIDLNKTIFDESATIVSAMREPLRFSGVVHQIPGTPWGIHELSDVKTVEEAIHYWQLVEPFCCSLQFAARLARGAELQPWVNSLRSILAETVRPVGGFTNYLRLRQIPCLVSTFVAALATVGEHRWDNFRALLVDPTVAVPDKPGERVSMLGAANPSWPFAEREFIAHAVARTVEVGEDAKAALTALEEGKVAKYYTPTAEWLHGILRPIFANQFPHDDVYNTEFDRAEVFLGVITQDQINVRATTASNDAPTYRPNWFGRSSWRANHGHNAVDDLMAEFTTTGEGWGPLEAGLFGGTEERAAAALVSYSKAFNDARALLIESDAEAENL